MLYASLLFTTIGVLRQRKPSAGESEDRRIESLVKDVLNMSAGRTLVTGVGVVLLAIGGPSLVRERPMMRAIEAPRAGVFFIRAAWFLDPDEAAGLDDAVRQVAQHLAGAERHYANRPRSG